MRNFNPNSKNADRAVQAWLILVSRAMSRQTITYEGLSELMYGKKAQGVLNKILGHIAFYCKEAKLPPLTSIVVGKGGVPGDKIPIDLKKIDSLRERVYTKVNWFHIYPPTPEELSAAYAKYHSPATC
jgi:hypothetical protein